MKKISQASEQEKIRALAELDGIALNWDELDCGCAFHRHSKRQIAEGSCPNPEKIFKDYLTSYDAIIPLIQKQKGIKIKILDALLIISTVKFSFEYTPLQLSDALLIATGKFEP